MPQRFLRGSFASLALVPKANAEDETGMVRIAAFLTSEGGGLTERSRVRDSDIGREFSADFVTDAQTSIDLRKARADSAARVVLAVEVHFDLRLRDQAVRDQQIVRTFDPADEKTSVAEVEGGRKFEEVRRRFSSSHPLFPSFTWRTQI
jgi:hypothetical protein